MLVLFLDKAKLTRLMNGDPCLFSKSAKVKSSRDVLLGVSKFLSGEGDITRHLLFLGYAVSHKQNPIDEFDYTLTHISQELRDGLRLAKIVETLSGDLTIIEVFKRSNVNLLTIL